MRTSNNEQNVIDVEAWQRTADNPPTLAFNNWFFGDGQSHYQDATARLQTDKPSILKHCMQVSFKAGQEQPREATPPKPVEPAGAQTEQAAGSIGGGFSKAELQLILNAIETNGVCGDLEPIYHKILDALCNHNATEYSHGKTWCVECERKWEEV